MEISAPAGLGKTHLLGEVIGYAERGGVSAVRGTASDGEQDVPLHPLLHAFGRPRGSGSWEQALRTVALRGATPGFAQYEELGVLLAERAGSGLVLALDNVHHADEATLRFLTHLARYPVPAPLLVILVNRPRQFAARLAEAELSWPALPASDRLPLAPLSIEDGARLLGMTISDLTYQHWHRECGGSPLGLLAARELASSTSGPAVEQLLQDYRRLPAAEASVIAAAAVLDAEADTDLLGTVAQLSATQTQESVRRLIGWGMLRPGVRGTLFVPRDETLRRAVYQQLDPLWRLDAHRRAGRALHRRCAPVAQRAEQLARCLSWPGAVHADGDLTVLLAAVDCLEPTAPLSAVRYLEVALRLVGHDSANRARRLELMMRRARILGTAGRLGDSRDVLHEILHALAPDDEARIPAVVACAQMERLLGHYPEALAVLRPWLPDGTGSGPAPSRLRVATEYAAVALQLRDFGAVREALASADQLLVGRTSEPVQVELSGLSALASASEGHVAAARDAAARGGRIVDSLPDSALLDRSEALYQLAWAEVFLEHHRDAERHLDRGLRLARRAGQRHTLPHVLIGLGQLACWSGRLPWAAVLLQEAIQTAEETGSRDIVSLALSLDALRTLWAGGEGSAAAAISQAEQALMRAPVPDGWWAKTAACILAQALWADGDPERCIVVLLEAGGGPDLTELQASLRPTWLHQLCTAALCVGDFGQARHWAAQAQVAADQLGLQGQRGHAEAACGEVLLAAEDPVGAGKRFRLAGTLFRQAGFALQQTGTLVLGARAVTMAGRPAAAAPLLRRARILAEQCGSARLAEMVAGAAVSAPPSAESDSSALDLLTQRELEVARLTATGGTNRAIARSLGVSPRTVDAHLSRIYQKLDVTSRAGLAAIVVRTGTASAR